VWKKVNITLDRRYDTLVVLVIVTACALSIWQGFYSVDPHHWGLMLSNTKDLLAGLAPYREFAIGYGILVPIIQGIAFTLISQSLISLQVATVFCYGAGLWILFRLALTITKDAKLSFYILCSCVLIHPIVIYPWPNYIAFPFLMGGIFYILKDKPSNKQSFVGGLLFGFAPLARSEYLLLAIVTFFVISIIDIRARSASLREILTQLLLSLAGLITPILIFAIYLISNNLGEYWFGHAWTLPFVATPKLFAHMHGTSIFDSLIRIAVWGFSGLNLRLIVIYLMIFANGVYCLVSIINRPKSREQTRLFKVSIISLLLVGELLHLPEVFRAATGTIIGLVPVYVLLKKVKLDRVFFAATSVIFIFILPPTTVESGNYFFPSKATISSAKLVYEPAIFKYQLWPEPVSQYYTQLSNDMETIKNLHCGVKYHFNYAIDVFLQVLSPFRGYQVLAFDNPLMQPAFDMIRPDLLSIEVKQKDLDVMIMRLIPNEQADAFEPPEGYFIYKKYMTPAMVFVPVNHTLMLMVPGACRVH
jgi:hypothetical protein